MSNPSSPASREASLLPDRDLPRWIWLGLPLGWWLALIPMVYLWPAGFKVLAQGDLQGGGVIENGTFVILLPGIAAGFAVFRRYVRAGVTAPEAWWFLGWALACIYFAGEEVSWGQHYLHWHTPDLIVPFNDQHETNFHNTSTWLDQKPRALVEAWIIIGGLLLPIWMLARRIALDPASLPYRLLPTFVCVPAAAAQLFTRVFEVVGKRTHFDPTRYLGGPELREFFVALFLAIYLMSAWRRLIPRSPPARR